jgi:hypothetical protein
MKSIPLPKISVQTVATACSQSITDLSLSQRLVGVIPTLVKAEADYVTSGKAGTLYKTKKSAAISGVVSASEMSRVYKGTFSRKGSIVRSTYYDYLKLQSPHGICPSCSQRVVSTLDHYLPKSKHPLYSITPANLVPSCSDCNKTKSSKQAKSADQQTLHPYFDDVEGEIWLKAQVVTGSPPGLIFFADPPASWTSVKAGRVRAHFGELQLAELYVANGGRLISDIGHRLNRLFDEAGGVAVKNHLEEEAISRLKKAKNSWQIASYLALSQSAYFCSYRHE